MTFHVLTLFPNMIIESTNHSILGRAIRNGLIKVNPVNIRDFAINKHGQVDDAPYGGGAGMVLMATPIYDAYKHVCMTLENEQIYSQGLVDAEKNIPVIYLSPQGKVFNQAKAKELSTHKEIILLCGHYEGIDERIIEEIVTEEISIGDYVLTGGEPAAMVLIDAVSRLVPSVLGKSASYEEESFSDSSNGLLEYPHYTRPAEFCGRTVPEILLSGHHAQIDSWRRAMSLERTKAKRPDLCIDF